MTLLLRSSDLVGYGIPVRRVNHLCDNLGFRKPGRGRARSFKADEAIILLLANFMVGTFEMYGVQRMIKALKRAKPNFHEVKTLSWELEPNKAKCLINKEGDSTITYTINLRKLIPKELLQ